MQDNPTTTAPVLDRLLTEEGRDQLVQLLVAGGVSLNEARQTVFAAAIEAILNPQQAREQLAAFALVH